ncbi:MAG: hypothetical protein ABIJ04_05640 [Bacteroidota bacterium]
MTPTNKNAPAEEEKPTRKRPVLLSILCIFTWVYYGIMVSFFLIALSYSGWITEIIHQYIPDKNWSNAQVFLLFLVMFVLHATAFTGVILQWKGHRVGYYLFSAPTILITIFHLFRPEISWLSTAVYAILVLLFGLFFRQIKNLPDVIT